MLTRLVRVAVSSQYFVDVSQEWNHQARKVWKTRKRRSRLGSNRKGSGPAGLAGTEAA
jgi:hypothetical protein